MPGTGPKPETKDILWRQTLGYVLAQYLRLSDALIDFYWADIRAREKPMLEYFTEWLMSTDSDAQRLRDVWRAWVKDYCIDLFVCYWQKPWNIARRAEQTGPGGGL
ncbi:hypothetical protein [Pseudomonas baetica]|uniref:hypothetical protein n=1 Tax=Pseudomonas baetica TaxID=674054 RepID=UPI0024076417|nr:hypothetical protein [Pseudomonas baetica]MDF9773328.1 hypothetical protein [Pseudomonas baetica]